MSLEKQFTIILRHPEQIRRGLAAARDLCRNGSKARLVFLCPGCRARLACGVDNALRSESRLDCFVNRDESCTPEGFRYAEPGRIAKMIRTSDVVIPV